MQTPERVVDFFRSTKNPMLCLCGRPLHQIDDLWIRGHYDPETSNDSPAVPGLGSTALSIVGSQVS